MLNRRKFIRDTMLSSIIIGSGASNLLAFDRSNHVKLTILHTNDVHSRIDPFPMDGGRNQGKGGVSRRAALINKIRKQEQNVLLFDAGDIFQGTPYFNMFGGELELKLMSEMGYDASTIGNHDFDGGIDGFVKQLPNANFPILVGNYDFSDTIMNGHSKPYQIFEKEGVRIGVFGIGIKLDGLVPKALYKDTRYLNPIKAAEKYSDKLKNELNCDYVICLSHLGYKYEYDIPSDIVLAKETSNIDLVIGGHTHTFMRSPDKIINKAGKETLVTQAGWGGILLGRIDVVFEKGKAHKTKAKDGGYIRVK